MALDWAHLGKIRNRRDSCYGPLRRYRCCFFLLWQNYGITGTWDVLTGRSWAHNPSLAIAEDQDKSLCSHFPGFPLAEVGLAVLGKLPFWPKLRKSSWASLSVDGQVGVTGSMVAGKGRAISNKQGIAFFLSLEFIELSIAFDLGIIAWAMSTLCIKKTDSSHINSGDKKKKGYLFTFV